MEHFSRAYFSRTRSRLLKKDNSYSRIQLKLVLTLEIHVLHEQEEFLLSGALTRIELGLSVACHQDFTPSGRPLQMN